MKNLSILILILSLAASFIACATQTGEKSALDTENKDSIYTALLMNHLRSNFDDIHDVSMRFHHMDHNLNGIITIQMHWENGHMTASEVMMNETNNEDFAQALITNIEKWDIKDLAGPFDLALPFRIKIVGSDDPTFSQKGIITGEVADENNHPVHSAKIHFRSSDNKRDTLRSCSSNREGIFVRTLIPAGSWDIECRMPGYKKVFLKNLKIQPGEHIRKRLTLEQNS